MRHLGSIILSLVLTPVIYVLIGIGMVKTGVAAADETSTDFVALAIGFVTLVSASLLYALLVLSRLSPLGPTLGALVLLVAQVWLLFDRDGFLSTFPQSVFGVSGAVAFPAGTGVALLLAIPMLATIVSPRRWRTSAQPSAPTPYAAAPSYGYQPYTPSYPPAPGGYPPAPGGYPPAPGGPPAPGSYPPAPGSYPPAPGGYPPAPGAPLYPGVPGAPAPTSAPPTSAPPTSAPPTSAPPISAPPGWVPPVPGTPTSAGDDESSATRPLYPAPSSFSTPPAPPQFAPPQFAPPQFAQPAPLEPAKADEPEPPTAPVKRPEPPADPDRTTVL